MPSLNLFKNFCDEIYLQYDRIIGRIITPSITLGAEEGRAPVDPERKRLIVYVHYDGANRIHAYVKRQVEALKKLGGDVVFVTPCLNIHGPDKEWLLNIAHKIFYKKDLGKDHTSTQIGLLKTPHAFEYKQIVLMNDSCYGPLCDMGEVFKRMEARNLDMWGITDSYERFYHIQSYFLVFNERIIRDGYLKKFWEDWPNYRSWKHMNYYGENRISNLAVKAGYKLGAVCEYTEMLPKVLADLKKRIEIGKKMRPADPKENKPWREIFSVLYMDAIRFMKSFAAMPCNQSHFFWDTLLDEGCPLLKIQLVRDNPGQVINARFYKDKIPAEELAIMEDHMKLTNGRESYRSRIDGNI